MILKFLWLAFCAYGAVVTAYLMVLTAGAVFFRKREGEASPTLSFAVVVPAHNEALQIRATVEGIRAVRYFPDLYRVVVLADNCDDDTARVAASAGAEVFVRRDPDRRGKGQALDWLLRERKEAYADCDAVAVVDADTRVHPEFLREISRSFAAEGVEVVQGYYGVSNPGDNWRTALLAAALDVFHHLRPAGRNRLGGTAGLKGNGMAFRREVLESRGWPAHSVVEDIEFSLRLLGDGILVHYNPDAMVFAEMAVRGTQAEPQRKRWEGGRFQLLRRFGPSLLSRFFKEAGKGGSRARFFDAFMDLLIPPLSLLVLVQCAMIAGSLWMAPSLVPAALLCLAGSVVYVFSGLAMRKAPLEVWFYLLTAPIFVLWKIPLYLRMMASPSNKTWERTRRRSELEKTDGKRYR